MLAQTHTPLFPFNNNKDDNTTNSNNNTKNYDSSSNNSTSPSGSTDTSSLGLKANSSKSESPRLQYQPKQQKQTNQFPITHKEPAINTNGRKVSKVKENNINNNSNHHNTNIINSHDNNSPVYGHSQHYTFPSNPPHTLPLFPQNHPLKYSINSNNNNNNNSIPSSPLLSSPLLSSPQLPSSSPTFSLLNTANNGSPLRWVDLLELPQKRENEVEKLRAELLLRREDLEAHQRLLQYKDQLLLQVMNAFSAYLSAKDRGNN